MKSQEGYIPPKAIYNTAQIDHIVFSILSPEEMASWSVLQITESKIYEGIHPVRGGVNDTRLGIIKAGQICETCGLGKECTGHFGHIKLAEPVFHLGFLKYVVKILKCICLNCSKLKYYTTEEQKRRFDQIMTIGNPAKRMGQLMKLLGNINKCPLTDSDGQRLGCGSFIPTKFIIKEKMRLIVIENEEKKNPTQVQYPVFKVKGILEKIDTGDAKILGFTSSKPANLVISVVPVAPPQIRPPVELGPEKRAEDDITNAYTRIVAYNNQIKQGLDSYKKNLNLREIQKIVGAIMVKLDQKYLPTLKEKSNNRKEFARKIKSLEERLISKEGRFRQHLMGKRVDFCARSVITPDPFIALNQVGVPESIAHSLTFPEHINEFNIDKILSLCKRGKVKFLVNPKFSQGQKQLRYIFLKKYRFQEIQEFIRIGMIAERELQNGDYVLFNRQPTLHRMSMMGHKVKILPHNTFRLNLSVCSPYNADFDGDEMNMHVPQTVQAVTELQFIAGVPHQIINPKNSTPIMGIVQDSLLGVYLMTKKDIFVTKSQIMNLVMWMDPLTKFNFGDLPMPCILKPEPLWSGKQVISMIIPQKITLYANRSKETLLKKNYEENLIIKDGELLCGVLKRDHVGPGSGKLIQAIWIQKGPEVACQFITNIQRVVTNWFMTFGFSVGLADIKPSSDLEQSRQIQIEKTNEDYYKNIHIFRNLSRYFHENFHQKGKKVSESLEYKVNLDLNNSLSRMQSIVTKSVSAQLNNICKMIDAKSKGSETNLTQIMFCLGNQNVDGQRCPQGFRKRALPHFLKDDNSPQPRGFVFSSFYHGLKPHQFFFHSMAGREGLSDTAVKTSNIGYIQRKLVKALEDVSVLYDGTVRDSKNNILQRFYGEDGFQPEFIEKHNLNQCLLKQEQFQTIYKWSQNKLSEFVLKKQQLRLISQEYQFLLEARKLLRERTVGRGQNNIEYDCPINIQRIVDQQITNRRGITPKQPVQPAKSIQIVEELARQCILPRFRKNFNEDMERLQKAEKQGKISYKKVKEAKSKLIKEYGAYIFIVHLKFWLSSTRVYYQYKINEKQLRTIANKIYEKYKRVLICAGEAIGSLAAQSIGEPTTQMTLNTFHLAGVADKNVTLGIPRLRQLLNVTKDLKTPYTTIYPRKMLFWEDRQSEYSQDVQNFMLEVIPQRSLRHYLLDSKIYFDSGKKNSQVDGTAISEIQATEWTSWMIGLSFQKEKIICSSTWRLILNTLQKNLGKEFNITQSVGIGQLRQPQINLRLNSDTLSRIGEEKAYKHLNLREMELRQYPLSGILGITAVKTARKKRYIVQQSEEFSLNLDQCIEQLVFEAVGSNLKKILANPFVDARRTISNNLYEIYQTLGIEAARQSFLNQFREILKPYSITINPRHLDVLVQWMTFRGNLVPINRFGINRVKDVSVLRKATFEETADVLYNAAVFSESDQLKGVSEKIIFGQKLSIGTNICRIYIDEKKVSNFVYQPSSNICDGGDIGNEQKNEQDQFTRNQTMQTPNTFQTPKLEDFTLQQSYLQTPIARSQIFSPVYNEDKELDQNSNSPKRSFASLSPSYSEMSGSKEIMESITKLEHNINYREAEKSPVYNTNKKHLNNRVKIQYAVSPTYTNKVSFSTSQGCTKSSLQIIDACKMVRPSQRQSRQKIKKQFEVESDSSEDD